jgi:serine/threonine-protein kinase
VIAESVMTEAERTQIISRSRPAPGPMTQQPQYDPADEPNHRRTGLIWAAVVFALLVVIGVAAYAIAFLGKDNGPKLTAIPSNLVNQTPAAVDAALRAAGFVPQQGPETNGPCQDGATGTPGRVCTLSPSEGQQEAKGTTVTYNLFTPKQVNVPPLVGRQLADAQYALGQAGLQYTITMVNNSAPQNQVIAQDPAPGTLEPPGYKVKLTVSKGTITLPDVAKKSFATAQAQLNAAGFTNVVTGATTITHDQALDGTVASESPTAGQAYPPSQQITLGLYQYQPLASSSACPTPTPTNSSSSPAPTSSNSASPSGSATSTC